jgi:hypothetical protein
VPVYLDTERLDALDATAFWSTEPYPWANPSHLLTNAGYEELLANLPSLELFARTFGKQRKAGQASHDRYSLEYDEALPVPKPWREFIDELRSNHYREPMRRLLRARAIEFRFHWHYTPTSASVSPHCDARRELGSHLFYFNAEGDWDRSWGGETLVLDDGGRLPWRSAPSFEEFGDIVAAECLGNRSLIFARGDHAWHGVREIRCPAEHMRRVFIVVINPSNIYWRVRDALVGKQIRRY